jgi:hypothetical protein
MFEWKLYKNVIIVLRKTSDRRAVNNMDLAGVRLMWCGCVSLIHFQRQGLNVPAESRREIRSKHQVLCWYRSFCCDEMTGVWTFEVLQNVILHWVNCCSIHYDTKLGIYVIFYEYLVLFLCLQYLNSLQCTWHKVYVNVMSSLHLFKTYWLLYAPTGLTLKNGKFCPHYICGFSIYLGKMATSALANINWLDFISRMKSIYCAVWIGSLNKTVYSSVGVKK